jgi:hypothetical protein
MPEVLERSASGRMAPLAIRARHDRVSCAAVGSAGDSFAGEFRALSQQAGNAALVGHLEADEPDNCRLERFDDAARQHVSVDLLGGPIQVQRQPEPVFSTYDRFGKDQSSFDETSPAVRASLTSVPRSIELRRSTTRAAS